MITVAHKAFKAVTTNDLENVYQIKNSSIWFHFETNKNLLITFFHLMLSFQDSFFGISQYTKIKFTKIEVLFCLFCIVM